MMRYSYKIEHISGKSFYIPDTLSRAPINEEVEESDDLISISEIDCYTESFFHLMQLQIQEYNKLKHVKIKIKLQKSLNIILVMVGLVLSSVKDSCRLFWSVRGELTLISEIILKGPLIYVPVDIRNEILE